jgi:hypothetical protein
MHLVPKSPETKRIVKEAFLSISKCWPVLGPGPDFKTQPDMFKGGEDLPQETIQYKCVFFNFVMLLK